MKVLVTGASGFLGNNLVKTLAAEGHDVIAVVREARKGNIFSGYPGVKIFSAGLDDIPALTDAAGGCDAIVHTAADTRMWPSESGMQHIVNVEYTRNVIRVARHADVGKLIHVSTVNALRPGSRKEQPGTEAQVETDSSHPLGYVATKRLAQELVLEAARDGLPAVVVNPSFMLGPFDYKPSSGALLLALHHGKVPGYTSGGRNFVHVRDVAAGIMAAIAKGRPGECYILGHQNLLYKEFFEIATDVLGKKRIRLFLPGWLAVGYGWANVAWSGISGKTPSLSQHMARAAGEVQFYSPEKAVRELALPQTSIETAIRESYDWFRQQGMLK